VASVLQLVDELVENLARLGGLLSHK
jgi:hypothetical protein